MPDRQKSFQMPQVLVRPFQIFFKMEAAGGVLLLVCAVIALLWANTPWAGAYFGLWQTTVTVGVGGFMISKPLLLWINDGLMAIFFFVVGLEIKREVLVGELASPKKAGLALAGALGGMVVPAVIYAVLNAGTDGLSGWGIPMATDIAFALGVLALLGPRVPLGLKVFLTALAIVDDLGAVLVIAFFYTAEISWGALGVGAGVLAALLVANRLRIQRPAVYVVLGVALWVALLKSGVHATLAGVLLALTIPARRRIDTHEFLARGNELLRTFARDVRPGKTEPSTDQRDAVYALEIACRHVETPLVRMEHALHGWVAFGIVPLFALANAGVSLGSGLAPGDPITLGILAGLFIGKQVGVTGFAWLAVRLGWAERPLGVSWRQIHGVSLLCGIGFTMSLFIANLAFDDPALLDRAKVGILTASLVAGLGGWFMLSRGANGKAQPPAS
ncbi:Na+/H+ antiporter NhaA [Rhodocaloribacter litoris]|uniref:Na+/H+ antiporter NhaA n=1 Tax=Rhodocaloribacter litoris TaxID=2558931 RepID=UPI001421E29C|nr:Na+/H+ antiporter NhaA [Rhodocaloribacter litoris]QXD16672.1 Na+/H+ antiporter NhaA [Rhodocaloribacter litoris]